MRISWILALSISLTACATPRPPAGPETDPAVLAAYHWQLREVRDSQGQAQAGWTLPPVPSALPAEQRQQAVQLRFADGQVTVDRLCNALSAGYQLDGSGMRIGPVRSTAMACSDAAAMALERRIGQRLPQASRWQLTAAAQGKPPAFQLSLGFADGEQWLLDGIPTDATRYGSPGQRIFLEVAPRRVACSQTQGHCLQVRSIEYDPQGLKTGIGPWHSFPGDIQGYEHQPGVRNVLRIQRYPLPGESAQAQAYAYVLDMTVETEIVR